MSTNSIPQKTAECLKVRVRTVEGPANDVGASGD